MNLRRFLLLTAVIAAPWTQAANGSRTSKTSADPASHIFADGTKPAFTVPAHGATSFVCRDYWDSVVAHGTSSTHYGCVQVSLPALPPGWYRLSFDAAADSGPIDFGIVLDRGRRPLPVSGRVGVDAATSWLIHDESKRREIARLLRTAGIPWVRERISWTGTEPRRGVFDWSRYQSTVDTLSAEGIQICLLWHDSPAWTRAPASTVNTPDDLRDVYRWALAASTHFRSQIQAWEPWNEMDIPPYWSDLADRYAAVLKAAYWGIRDGAPGATVVMGSLATNPPGTFARNVYESGGMDYADRFNWHIYTEPSSYADALKAHRALQRETGVTLRHAWITEAGIRIPASGGPENSLLDTSGRRLQARFAAESVVSSLAAGDERYFFFVLPDHLENGMQFGMLEPDLSPYPSFVSLSAAANLLGESKYLGVWPAPNGVQAYVFSTPNGPVVALWSESSRTVELPCAARRSSVANLFGARRQIAVEAGRLLLPIGPEVTYLLNPAPAILAAVRSPLSLPLAAPAQKPSRIVVAGAAILPVSKENGTYRIGGPDSTARFRVEVYNLAPGKAADGELHLKVPPGWKVSPERLVCRVGPFGRFEHECILMPADDRDAKPRAVAVTGNFAGEKVTPSVSYFQRDLASIVPVSTVSLPWLPAAKWRLAAAPTGAVTVGNVPGGIRIDANFQSAGDHWAYPVLAFDSPIDLSDCDGLSLTLDADGASPNSWMRVMMMEPGGSVYFTGTPELGSRRRIVFLFSNMKHGHFSPSDPDGHLDLHNVSALKVGFNTPDDNMHIIVTDLCAVKFAPAPPTNTPPR